MINRSISALTKQHNTEFAYFCNAVISGSFSFELMYFLNDALIVDASSWNDFSSHSSLDTSLFRLSSSVLASGCCCNNLSEEQAVVCMLFLDLHQSYV